MKWLDEMGNLMIIFFCFFFFFLLFVRHSAHSAYPISREKTAEVGGAGNVVGMVVIKIIEPSCCLAEAHWTDSFFFFFFFFFCGFLVGLLSRSIDGRMFAFTSP